MLTIVMDNHHPALEDLPLPSCANPNPNPNPKTRWARAPTAPRGG